MKCKILCDRKVGTSFVWFTYRENKSFKSSTPLFYFFSFIKKINSSTLFMFRVPSTIMWGGWIGNSKIIIEVFFNNNDNDKPKASPLRTSISSHFGLPEIYLKTYRLVWLRSI